MKKFISRSITCSAKASWMVPAVHSSSSKFAKSGNFLWETSHVKVTPFKHETFRKYCISLSESSSLRNKEGVCWKCRKKLSDSSKFFCASCGVIVPARKDDDYFALFDLKPGFLLSTNELQARFKGLQTLLHPDKFSLKSASEAAISESVSSLLNKAYSTLARPLSRGLYMLEMEGITMGEDVSTDDPEFLMEIMEINEQIAEMTSIDDLQREYRNIKTEVETLTALIAKSFLSKDLKEAETRLVRFKYFDNLLEKLRERLPPT